MFGRRPPNWTCDVTQQERGRRYHGETGRQGAAILISYRGGGKRGVENGGLGVGPPQKCCTFPI